MERERGEEKKLYYGGICKMYFSNCRVLNLKWRVSFFQTSYWTFFWHAPWSFENFNVKFWQKFRNVIGYLKLASKGDPFEAIEFYQSLLLYKDCNFLGKGLFWTPSSVSLKKTLLLQKNFREFQISNGAVKATDLKNKTTSPMNSSKKKPWIMSARPVIRVRSILTKN